MIPDADALQDWREKVKALNLPNIKVSTLCAGHAGGWDIGDIIRDKFIQRPQTFTPTQPKPEASAVAAATPDRKCRIIRINLFPDSYDYLSTFDHLQLPPDFFTERLEAAPF